MAQHRGEDDISRFGRVLVWIGSVGIVAAAVFFDWAYVEGQPAAWGDRTPLWLYAVGVPVLLGLAVCQSLLGLAGPT